MVAASACGTVCAGSRMHSRTRTQTMAVFVDDAVRSIEFDTAIGRVGDVAWAGGMMGVSSLAEDDRNRTVRVGPDSLPAAARRDAPFM